MDIIRIFGIVFLLIMAAGFIAALSEKGGREDQPSDEKKQAQSRVVVTQRVPSVLNRRNHRR